MAEKFYVQVMGLNNKREFQEVDGTPIWIKGAEDADLFLHRSVTGGGWRVSSGINGMYVGDGDTKKAAVGDASQKGKPEAIVKQLRHYVRSGESVSPRVSPEKLESYFDHKSRAGTKPVNLEWDGLHKQSREELLVGAGMQTKLADKKWADLEPWIQGLLKDSLEGRSKGKAKLEALNEKIQKATVKYQKDPRPRNALAISQLNDAYIAEAGKEPWRLPFSAYKEYMSGKKVEHSYHSREGQLQQDWLSSVETAIQLGKPVERATLISARSLYPHKVGEWKRKYGAEKVPISEEIGGDDDAKSTETITIDPGDPDLEVWKPKSRPRKAGKLVLLVRKRREKPETTIGGMR